MTAVAGLLAPLLVSWLAPVKAFAGSLVLAGGYLVVNGYVLFARHDLIVEADSQDWPTFQKFAQRQFEAWRPASRIADCESGRSPPEVRP